MNELQSAILDVFEQFRDVCENNNLRYFAIGGTSIGAAREHGFISWDDDLDIGMPMEDYLMFLEIADRCLPNGYELVSPDNREAYNHFFAKVCNKNTMYVVKNYVDMPERYFGVYIDVFPMSGVPSSDMGYALFKRRLRFLYLMNKKLRFPKSSCKGLKSKVVWTALAPIRAHDVGFAYKRWLKLVSKRSFYYSECVSCTSWPINSWPRLRSEWFREYVDVPFEDTEIVLPVDYDSVLTTEYGDYMTAPAADARKTHGGYFDLAHSYSEYAEGRLRIDEGFWDRANAPTSGQAST